MWEKDKRISVKRKGWTFQADLAVIIKQQFDKASICYDSALDVCGLAARYLEMLNRRIVPTPRRVHFSEEIHDSLGALGRKADMEQREKAAAAKRERPMKVETPGEAGKACARSSPSGTAKGRNVTGPAVVTLCSARR